MTKKVLALPLLAVLTAACADSDSEPGVDRAPPNSASTASESMSGPTPCEEHDVRAAKPRKTLSPVEKCDGAYLCISLARPVWFSFDGQHCRLGGLEGDVFRNDGTMMTFTGKPGRWVGDHTSFEVSLDNGETDSALPNNYPNPYEGYACTRVPD